MSKLCFKNVTENNVIDMTTDQNIYAAISIFTNKDSYTFVRLSIHN